MNVSNAMNVFRGIFAVKFVGRTNNFTVMVEDEGRAFEEGCADVPIMKCRTSSPSAFLSAASFRCIFRGGSKV